MSLILPASSSPDLKAFPLCSKSSKSSEGGQVLPAFFRVVSSRCRVRSQPGAAKTGENVCFVQLRYRSTPQTPQTRRRSLQPCSVVLLSDPQYPWRKDPHLPSQPPSSATCRARTGLPPMPFVASFRLCFADAKPAHKYHRPKRIRTLRLVPSLTLISRPMVVPGFIHI